MNALEKEGIVIALSGMHHPSSLMTGFSHIFKGGHSEEKQTLFQINVF